MLKKNSKTILINDFCWFYNQFESKCHFSIYKSNYDNTPVKIFLDELNYIFKRNIWGWFFFFGNLWFLKYFFKFYKSNYNFFFWDLKKYNNISEYNNISDFSIENFAILEQPFNILKKRKKLIINVNNLDKIFFEFKQLNLKKIDIKWLFLLELDFNFYWFIFFFNKFKIFFKNDYFVILTIYWFYFLKNKINKLLK